ncbi:MAG TPA: hypothetical protein VHS09_06595, partial [Polyangiaceae bacterium]|nr:hypothetical protein [Polyangiaceae bacterium]
MSHRRSALFAFAFVLGVAALPAPACTSFKSSGAADVAGPDGAAGDTGPGAGDAAAGADGTTGKDGGGAVDSGTAGKDAPGGDDGGAACDGASCPVETVVDGLNQGTLVLVDGTNVYFGDEGTITGNVYQ